MAKWQAVITKVGNGFSVDFKGGDNPCTTVYQEKEIALEEQDNKEHIIEMFWGLLEHFGEIGSKHDKKRIFIEWREQ